MKKICHLNLKHEEGSRIGFVLDKYLCAIGGKPTRAKLICHQCRTKCEAEKRGETNQKKRLTLKAQHEVLL